MHKGLPEISTPIRSDGVLVGNKDLELSDDERINGRRERSDQIPHTDSEA